MNRAGYPATEKTNGTLRPRVPAELTSQGDGIVTNVHPGVQLPSRYRTDWRRPFEEGIRGRLREGMTVVDVGSGRNPAVPPGQRPRDTTYIGLDLSREELVQAGSGAYDQLVVADVATPVPQLVGAVDVVGLKRPRRSAGGNGA